VSLITLTTDFGGGSPYVAAMKGVILSINPHATVVDITHDIPPQDVRCGAIVLADTAEWFPAGTIHVAVIDPGVGTERAIVYSRIGSQQFIAPDNGVLSCLAARTPPQQLVRLTEPAYWLDEVSATFHGRDIMAPVAAQLTLGLDPARLGPPLEKLVALDWPAVRVKESSIEGEVLAIDSFGNLITNIAAGMLAGRPTDDRVRIVCGNHETRGICRTYGDRPPGTRIALLGSSGRLELAVVAGSAAESFGIRVGAAVALTWKQ
jgi:S-adenosylmethionine hydrolase